MVLPSTSSSLRQQDRRLNAIYKKNTLINHGDDDDDNARTHCIKADVKRAADEALRKVDFAVVDNMDTILHSTRTAAANPLFSQQESSADSHSVGSTEIAVERGSMRAMSESNEHNHHRHHLNSQQSAQSFEIGTTSTMHAAAVSVPPVDQRKKGIFKSFFRKKKRTPPGMSVLVAGISKEAWMCGCCGKVFSKFESADYHEKRCILGVINGSAAVMDDNEDASQQLLLFDDQGRSPKYSPFAMQSPSGVISPRRQKFFSPFASPTRDAMDDELMNEVGLGDIADNYPSERSLYVSARSIQLPLDAPSPWGPESRLSTTPLNDVGLASPPRIRDRTPPTEDRMVSFRDDFPPRRSPPSGTADPFRPGTSSFLISPAISFDRSTTIEPANHLLLTRSMKQQVIVTDQALVNSVARAAEILLTRDERDAETELACIAADRMYYQEMTQRACVLKAHPSAKFRSEGKTVASKIQNKFVDAWQLIKEGDAENINLTDEYGKKHRGDGVGKEELVHNANTHYVNVFVKHSLRVVNSELERLAQQRWEDHGDSHRDSAAGNFEQFRKFAHVNLVKLAKLALAADFTPRKVAVQLSNDLYRYVMRSIFPTYHARFQKLTLSDTTTVSWRHN